MLLTDALDALGDDGTMGSYTAEVPLAAIVGSAARRGDFDADFTLTNKALQDRRRQVTDAFANGTFPPPLDLVRLGELYFVRDGHHLRGWRGSVSIASGRTRPGLPVRAG